MNERVGTQLILSFVLCELSRTWKKTNTLETHIIANTRRHTHVHIYIHIYIYICMYVNTHTCAYTKIYTYDMWYIYIYKCFLCVSIYVNMYMYAAVLKPGGLYVEHLSHPTQWPLKNPDLQGSHSRIKRIAVDIIPRWHVSLKRS